MKLLKAKDVYTIFKGKYVTGEFLKKDGTLRIFWGQLIYDDRHPTTITFFDKRKKQFRRISLSEGKLIVRSGSTEVRHVVNF
tara:strand:+ start:362 stop:607 length:246 start_codon:yes stop_codon:yes gene_type:complete